jgi:flagellar assembly protein FliH
MSDAIDPVPPLLRNVALQAQPRLLARPQRPAALAPVASASTDAGLGAGAAGPVAPAAPAARPAQALGEEIEAARAQGLQEGREAGLQLGLKDAQARLDEATQAAQAAATAQLERESARLAKQWADRLARLDAVVKSIDTQLPRHWESLEADAAELAFEVVCRVLGDAPGRRQLIEGMVTQAMSGLRTQPLRVRLSAADLALIDETGADGAGLRARHPRVEWIADPAVQAGGCLIDGDGGTLDARLEVQLQRLLQQWRGAAARETAA